MGCTTYKNGDHEDIKKIFNIKTLNYSGILTSPYEFFSTEDNQQRQYSQTFAQIVSKKYPNFIQNDSNFNWNMESIDPNWKSRYATINMINAGVNPITNKMMTGQQFMKTWQDYYEKTKDALKRDYFEKKHKQNVQQAMEIQIKRCKQFDFFCYQTMLKIYCGVDIQNMKNDVDSVKYIERRKQWFDKTYLNQQKKVKKTIDFLTGEKNPEIMYFQQTNKNLVENLKHKLKQIYLLREVKDSKSIILIKRGLILNQNIDQQNKKFLQVFRKRLLQNKKIELTTQDIQTTLNFNKDSAFQYLQQHQLLLINVHLNSKTKKNQVQLESLRKEYSQILELFPSIDILLGGDFNITMKKQYFQGNKKESNIIPSQTDSFSVKKKRTFMQPQRKKANTLDLAAKDFLISTILIGKGVVTTIQQTKLQNIEKLPLLPNQSHPYDHFIVQGSYLIKKGS